MYAEMLARSVPVSSFLLMMLQDRFLFHPARARGTRDGVFRGVIHARPCNGVVHVVV